jgi:hypothetical protein
MIALSTLALTVTMRIPAQMPAVTTPKVVSVSMFKNGFAFITREVPLNDGAARIVEVPQTSLGSLWFWTTEGALESVTAANDVTTKNSVVPFRSWDQVLAANIGKKFRLTIANKFTENDKLTDKYFENEGVVRAVNSTIITLEGEKQTYFIERSKLLTVTAIDSDIVVGDKVENKVSNRFYELKAGKGSKVCYMMSLERGMAWAPGYAVEIGEKDKVTFTAKATVLNDLVGFQDAKVRLITGFPNIQFSQILDPLSSNMSLDQWLASLNPGMSSPGGFDGSGGGMMLNQSRSGEAFKLAAPLAITPSELIATNDVNNVASESLEDLFYYDLPNISLQKGSRSYQYIYKFDSTFKRTYNWDGNEGSPVLNKIKFKNTSGKPISTAAATMFRKGEVVGQGMMNYTPANTDVELMINRALDLSTTVTTDVVDRAKGAIKDKKGVPVLDLVTYEIEYEIVNPKEEVVNFQIDRFVSGDYISGSLKPEINRTSNGVRGQNASSKLKWEFKIDSGKTYNLKYRFKTFERTIGEG